jgi:hypothetical protein
MRKALVLAVATIALAACGVEVRVDEKDGSAAAESGTEQDSTTFETRAGGVLKAPDNLPSFVKIYPGLSVTSTMGGATAVGSGGSVVGATPDPMDKVAAYYKGVIQAEGLGNVSETSVPDMRMLSAGEPDGRVLSVILQPNEGGGTQVSLQYSNR